MTLPLFSHPVAVEGLTGQAWGRGRKTHRERERPTFSCIAKEEGCYGLKRQTLLSLLLPIKMPLSHQIILCTLSYYLHIYFLILQQLGEAGSYYPFHRGGMQAPDRVSDLSGVPLQITNRIRIRLWAPNSQSLPKELPEKGCSLNGKTEGRRSATATDGNTTKPGMEVEKVLMKRQPGSQALEILFLVKIVFKSTGSQMKGWYCLPRDMEMGWGKAFGVASY